MKNKANIISEEFFQVSLSSYLILLLVETYKEGFVSNFFNVNYLLAVVFVSGVVMVLTGNKQDEDKKMPAKKLGRLDFNFIVLSASIGAALIYIKTNNLGNISLVITGVVFLLIYLLSYLVLTGEDSAEV